MHRQCACHSFHIHKEELEGGLVFSRDGEQIWQCSNCGHICIGKQAPDVCPVCDHARAYFRIEARNY